MSPTSAIKLALREFRALWAMNYVHYIRSLQKTPDDRIYDIRQAILSFLEESARISNGRMVFRLFWRHLIVSHLRVLDVEGATRIATLAQARGLAGADAFKNSLDQLIATFKGLSEEIERAFASAVAPVGTGDLVDPQAKPITVCISMEKPRTDGNAIVATGDLVKIYSEVFKTLRGAGIPYSVKARFRRHGTPYLAAQTDYISYHSIDVSGHGLHFKETDRPNCYSFDSQGYSGWAEFSRLGMADIRKRGISPAEAEASFERDRLRIIKGNISKYAQSNQRADLPNEPYIFVALQTANDAVQQLAYIPMLDMLADVAEHARRIGCRVVVKRHPRCNDSGVALALLRGRLRGQFTVSTASVHTLIEHALAVCTVNSSVGAEALLHLKPVYLFGRSEYRAVCYEVTRKGQFAEIFAHDAMRATPDDIKLFLYALRAQFAVDLAQPDFAEKIRRHVLDFINTRRPTQLDQ